MNKMKRWISTLLILVACGQWVCAQAPKWIDKAKQAVFSVVTYDENQKMINSGNAFFVSEDGVAVSDYSLFKGASRAVAVTSEGVKMPVECILGANDMFDVVKFKVKIAKKVSALTPSSVKPSVGTAVYLLPYSTQKDRSFTQGSLQQDDKASGNYSYYTLAMRLKDKMVSCPVMTADGQVFGLAQKSSGKDTATICYAMDVHFALDQQITAFSLGNTSLNNIGIRKALPDTEEQALVYLYMASTQLSADRYMEVLDNFILQYPQSADGYMRRATQQLSMSKEEDSMRKVQADMDKALSLATKKDEIYFSRAKLIYNYMLQQPEPLYQDWSLDKAVEEVRKAIDTEPLPVYVQLEGDLYFAKKEYAQALSCYEQVNGSNVASASSFFSAAKSKEMMDAPAEEVVALLDSCVARFSEPYRVEAAPYLWERAQARMSAGQVRLAVMDYDAYFKAVNGDVNDVFYSYREQAAMQSKQFQRALDDISKAIELNPGEITYRAELAVINLRVGRNEEALRVLEEAMTQEADNAELYRLKGLTLVQMKRQKEACEALAKAKELGHTQVDALIEKYCK